MEFVAIGENEVGMELQASLLEATENANDPNAWEELDMPVGHNLSPY
jgi:hypothetical protein